MTMKASPYPVYFAIADDHPTLLKGLRYIISSFDDCEVIIEALNGQELITKIEQSAQKPHICILDLSMPVLNGYQTLKIIRQQWADIKVIILSMHHNEFTIIKTFKDGACACLPKDAAPEELKVAVEQVLQKGFYYSELAEITMYNLSHESSGVSKISQQELEFLKQCCTDMNYQQISVVMCVSPRTVDGYRDSLFNKLGVKSRTGLAIFAMRSGLVPLS